MTLDPLSIPRPSDPAAERSILGCAMRSEKSFDEIITLGITGADFDTPAHENVWSAIVSLSDRGAAYDSTSVIAEMRRAGTGHSIHGVELVSMWADAQPAKAPWHARILMELSARRRAIAASLRTIQTAVNLGASVEDLQGLAMAGAESIASPVDDSTWSILDDVVESVLDAAEQAAAMGRPGGIEWGGLADVAREMSPMVPGEFAVVSAFSGGGKSIMSCNLALHAAVHQGKRVLVHAMEMTRLEVGQRWVASEARVELERVISGRLSPSDQERIDRAVAKMIGAPLVIDEVETVTLAGLRASVRKHRPEFVVVDQIPTMTPTDSRMPREQQVSAIAYGLKRLAKSEGIPVLACCQLNANPTRRNDKTPTMHDLRESQAIVQAANTLVILSDPMEVDKESGRLGEIDWIVRKQRQGPKDITIPLARLFHYSKLACLAGED